MDQELAGADVYPTSRRSGCTLQVAALLCVK